MTTAATITANLILNSRQYQQGLKTAGAATTAFQSKVQRLTAFVKQNAAVIAVLGDGLQQLGRKMTTFITIPIIAFFTLAIKKAAEADSAMGKMAQDSLAKLNEQMAKLGEKFLPMVIKLIDFLVAGLEKFNNAPPWVQNVVLAIIGLVALAGPITSFIGSILSVTSALSTMGTTAATLIPTIVTLGTSLWAALAPLLPVLALVAALVVLVYMLWKNWDELGVIIKQLWAIIKWEFQMGTDMIRSEMDRQKKLNEDLVDALKGKWQEFSKWVGAKWKEITAGHDAMVAKIRTTIVGLVQQLIGKFNEFRNNVVNAVNYVAGVFFSVFAAIGSFVSSIIVGIINGINVLIDAINSLGFALENLDIPDELVPGSPTPFEMGLRGITKAMDTLSKKSIPEMNAAFAGPSGMNEVRGGQTVNYTDNRRFSAGVTPEAVKLALQNQFEGLENAIANS